VFKEPNKVVLDRMPNPHIGFGFGIHNCLGAPQTPLIIRSLLHALCEQVKSIELISFEPRIEKEESYTRQVGYDQVVVKIN
jgi:cytochrome P450